MEPTYTYVRGQGWVLDNNDTVTVELFYKRITLINREPVVGEQYIQFPIGSDYVENGKIKLQKFAEYLKTNMYSRTTFGDYTTFVNPESCNPMYPVHATFIVEDK